MARNGRRIEMWKHPEYGVEIAIRLDLEGVFLADFNNQTYTASTLPDIRQQLISAVTTTVKLTWKAIIEVSCRSRQQTDRIHEFSERVTGGIDLDFRRFWVAEKPDGTFLVCNVWYSQTNASPFPYPIHSDANRSILDRLVNAQPWYTPVKPLQLPYIKEKKNYGGFRNDRDIFLEYTPELWDALMLFVIKMEDIATRIEGLLETANPLLILMPLAQKLALPEVAQ